jgi:putative DNA primase/helicase
MSLSIGEKKKGKNKKRKVEKSPEDRLAISEIYAKKIFNDPNNKFIYDKNGFFWRYDTSTGLWKTDAKEYIRNILRKDILQSRSTQTNHCVEEIVSFIKDISWNPDTEVKLPDNIFSFKNCLYDIDKKEIIKFSPNYFTTNKLPIELKEEFKECPAIDKFCQESIGEEYKIILYELIAYCLYRGYPYQKIFFIFGGGNNGKSTYNSLITSFLGNENISNISPHELAKDQYATSELWNKLANVSSDISYAVIDNFNKLKEISGGDTVRIHKKYHQGFPDKISAKLIFSMNQLPIIQEKTFAIDRRLYPIPFLFEPKSPDRELIKKLTTPQELSGLAWRCLNILKYLKDENFCFTFDTNPEEVKKIYSELSDPLDKFIKAYTTEDESGKVTHSEFTNKFSLWLKKNKLRMWNYFEIIDQMKKKYPDVRREIKKELTKEEFDSLEPSYQDKVKFLNGKYVLEETPRCWTGFKFKDNLNLYESISNKDFDFSKIYVKTR